MEILPIALFYLFMPMLILYLCHRYPPVAKVGAVILAYAIGLVLGNIGLLPSPSPALNELMLNHPQAGPEEVSQWHAAGLLEANDLMAYRIYQLRDLLMTITILLAIPLMLFSSNLNQWKRVAGKTLVSLLVGLLAVMVVVVGGYFVFSGVGIKDLWKVSGMLIGVYTGGTPNLASLKMMLDVDPELYILTHTYDLVIGVFYLAFLITIGKKLFQRFLPPFPISKTGDGLPDDTRKESFWSVLQAPVLWPLLKGVGLAALIAGAGGALSLVVPSNLVMVAVILTITTLAILASLIPGINRIPKTFDAGMYLILIFSLVVSSMADVRNFAGITPGLFAYITLAVFGSLLLHVLLSKVFKVDADTTMITSVAFICSPPFVPVIAGAIGNRQVIISGITIGIIGYAMGNYLGVMVAYFLR